MLILALYFLYESVVLLKSTTTCLLIPITEWCTRSWYAALLCFLKKIDFIKIIFDYDEENIMHLVLVPIKYVLTMIY